MLLVYKLLCAAQKFVNEQHVYEMEKKRQRAGKMHGRWQKAHPRILMSTEADRAQKQLESTQYLLEESI